MISRYNSQQLIGATFSALTGFVCFVLAYLFFRYVPEYVFSMLDIGLSTITYPAIAAVCLLILTAPGYRTWKNKGGLTSYHESAFYHDLGDETAGAAVVDLYAHRITAPAHVLTQLFLAGPLLILKAVSMVKSVIPKSPDLESRLAGTLATLRAANKWQSINDYPALRTEILYLARMGKINFSAREGAPRIKAHKSHGV